MVVLVSLVTQGWTTAPMARFLGLVVPPRQGPVDRIELELPGSSRHEVVAYSVHPESAVAHGQRVPRWARPALVIRNGQALRPHRFGPVEGGDRIYLVTTPEYVGLLDRLFAGPAPGADDPALYGDFKLEPDATLFDVARAYPLSISPGDENLTVSEFLRRELPGDIEQGDRVSVGAVDLIARRVSDNHTVEEVGLAVEHSPVVRPRIHIPPSWSELKTPIMKWFRRM